MKHSDPIDQMVQKYTPPFRLRVSIVHIRTLLTRSFACLCLVVAGNASSLVTLISLKLSALPAFRPPVNPMATST
jgi:hypothetical protein